MKKLMILHGNIYYRVNQILLLKIVRKKLCQSIPIHSRELQLRLCLFQCKMLSVFSVVYLNVKCFLTENMFD